VGHRSFQDGTFVKGHGRCSGLPFGAGQFVMIFVCLLLIYLAIVKEFEPLLLLPIGFGGLLANMPFAGLTHPEPCWMPQGGQLSSVLEPGGFLYYIFSFGVDTGIFPILIFMGVGAMTDFGPLIANPRTALLGAAAQLGIFAALIGALALNDFVPGITTACARRPRSASSAAPTAPRPSG
jgi:Na+-transporting methylmalonyl-CoA/oxaloacetate decarboxylase beta subunit